jgi:signal transduction histidine kinase
MLARLFPNRLSHWLVGLVIGAILVTQAFALTLYHADRMRAIDTADSRQAAQCLAGFAQVLASEPPDQRRAMMRPLMFRQSRIDGDQDERRASEGGSMPLPPPPIFMIHLPDIPGEAADPDSPTPGYHTALIQHIEVHGILPDGTRLMLDAPPSLGSFFTVEFGAYMGGVMAVGLFGSAWAIALATKPLRRLSDAADRFGADVYAAPLPETGPHEVRQAAAAFNRMQRRLRQFVLDRTRMLAAISHDLRTPLTRMRLRAEMLEDSQQRQKMMDDLDEMEGMVGATLAFAREDVSDEASECCDLGQLLESIADDAQFALQPVTLAPPPSLTAQIRPRSMKRAIVNVIDNAVRYGGGAALSLRRDGDEAVIGIVDHGPGIPEGERENVLRPFYRCEDSRSRETGGIGLGLSIASDIVGAQGGRIALSETPGGGLTVELRLPA